ncbi:TetR family transcriptional regulator [Kitasatospora sp. NPDC050543]|uniref:TetR family transcriptional regulator n=1 Tax=Kitasatospora sp. NPDC050543 TaxID=3364054 RepID=UPI0037A98CC9
MSNAPAAPALPRRDQIRREAARLFAARGFLGVGVDEIGKAVGISGPGLYRHFAGKDAMLADLLIGISERLLQEGRRRVGAGGDGRMPGAGQSDGATVGADLMALADTADTADPAGATGATGAMGVAGAAGAAAVLDSLISGHVDFALDDRDLITLHDRELLHLKEEDRRRVRRLQRGYLELWVDVVRQAFPPLAEPDAEPVARAAVHAVFGLLNSTPHSLGPHVAQGERPGLSRDSMAALLHSLAHGAFVAAAESAGRAAAA